MFKKNFIFGTATASYQIEGAYNEDGKGLNIWDTFSHLDGKIANNDNGDIALDHYHKYKEDVQEMVKLGIDSYRFSISWSRVIPKGVGEINLKGIAFYNNLINELIENNIVPSVTLYHWDLPNALQEKGGFLSDEFPFWYESYAKEMFSHFGDRVKKWITFNEPWVSAFAGHFDGRHAPGIKDFKSAIIATNNILLAHARAVNLYKNNNYDGEIGITLNLYPMYANSDSKEDILATKLVDEYHNKLFLDPIFKGEFPAYFMSEVYKETGFSVKPEDLELIKSAKTDFLGVNYYFRKVIEFTEKESMLKFSEVKPDGDYTDMNWEIYEDGLYKLLMDLKNDYSNPKMYITENGIAYGENMEKAERLKDAKRIKFIESHLEMAKKAIDDGVNLHGYYLWSLFDNFEWAYGYNKRFGIIDIDYKTLERTWKDSGYWYRDYIKNNK